MKRLANSYTLLARYIHANRNTPFAWGTHDCALFTANCVQTMTGTDMATEFRGKYSDAASAATIIKAYAGGGLAELMAKKATEFGLKEIPIPFASRGDLVLLLQAAGGDEALGIVGMDAREAISTGEKGLHRVQKSAWIKVWRI